MAKKFDRSTQELSRILSEANKKEALENYLKELKEEGDCLNLQNYLNEMMAKNGRQLSDVARDSGLSPNYVYNIVNGSRKNPSRMKIIGICIACHMTLDETQRALEIAGKGILYPRDPADAIIIFNINAENRSVADINDQLHEHGYEIIQ